MSVHTLEACSWCSRPCIGVDSDGDPACSACVSETAAQKARTQRRERELHEFVVTEFRRKRG